MAQNKAVRNPINGEPRPSILSLFCGCGGLDLGFEQADYHVGLAYDLRPPAVASHNHNLKNKKSGFVRDVSRLTLPQLDADFGEIFSPKGVIGGPPCQSFSRGNVAKKENDPRTKMVRKFFDLALSIHKERNGLDFIVMENVPEVARAEKGELLLIEIKRLEKEGFEVHAHIYDTSHYGVAQKRRRMILVALNKTRISNPWAKPEKQNKVLTVRDKIGGLGDPITFCDADLNTKFPVHSNHWCMTPKSPKFFDGSLSPGRSTGRSFKTLSWDKPSYTVSYGHREVHVHPDCKRRLSVYEAMLLQGFPKSFELKGSLSDQLSQVSEAVPPPLAKAIAKSIIDSIYPKKSVSNLSKATL